MRIRAVRFHELKRKSRPEFGKAAGRKRLDVHLGGSQRSYQCAIDRKKDFCPKGHVGPLGYRKWVTDVFSLVHHKKRCPLEKLQKGVKNNQKIHFCLGGLAQQHQWIKLEERRKKKTNSLGQQKSEKILRQQRKLEGDQSLPPSKLVEQKSWGLHTDPNRLGVKKGNLKKNCMRCGLWFRCSFPQREGVGGGSVVGGN